MLIPLTRLRLLAFFALLFCFSRFNAAFGGLLEGPGTPKKTVLVRIRSLGRIAPGHDDFAQGPAADRCSAGIAAGVG
jgi:hypothetical protein